MEPTSRRSFLRNTSIAVAAAGVATAVPATAGHALDRASDRNPPPVPADAAAEVPVVAHVRDLRKGEVVLYTGEREVAVTDKRLASLLYHATR